MNDFEEALRVLNGLVFAKTGKHLTHAETIVVKAAWFDLDYKEVAAQNLSYSVDYLQRNIGRRLWVLLTGILGNGEKVSKKRLRSILERRIAVLPDFQSHFGSTPASTTTNTCGCVFGQLPNTSSFYGRDKELDQLRELTAKNRCLVLYGPVGIGKSALTAKLLQKISAEPQQKFEYLVWKPVPYGPSLQSLLTDLLKAVQEPDLPESIQEQIALLIEVFQTQPCLIVLDAAEAWLRKDRNTSYNPYDDNYTEYGMFFRRISEEKHSSCILLTSREPFKDLMKLERSGRPSYSFKLEGLDLKAAKEILHSRGLTDEQRWEELLEPYLGNPEAIKLVASRIENFCNGSVAQFLKYKTALISEIYREILSQQCQPGRLTHLEKQIVLYLVEKMIDTSVDSLGRTSFSQLVSDMQIRMKNTTSLSNLMEAVEALNYRSLIVVSKDPETKEFLLKLPILVKQYVLKEKRDALDQEERVRFLSVAHRLFNSSESSESFAV